VSMTRLLLFASVVVTVAACAGPTVTASSTPTQSLTPTPTAIVFPSTSPTRMPTTGVEGLVADLQRAGAQIGRSTPFNGTPLSSEGVNVCVNHEEVSAYVYSSDQARESAAASIDRHDPWHIGSAVVEWLSPPTFWQRDRILVLYVGADLATTDLLVAVLGQPFAMGEGRKSPQLARSC
jgi:hypothetical protein